jgi:hypothetical protein
VTDDPEVDPLKDRLSAAFSSELERARADLTVPGVRRAKVRPPRPTVGTWLSLLAACALVLAGAVVLRVALVRPAGTASSIAPASTPAVATESPSPSVGPSQPALAHYAGNGIAFDYPGSWTVHDQFPASSGFGQTNAILGNQPWGPCDATDINCLYRERLGPGQIGLEVGFVALVRDDLCTSAKAPLDPTGRGPSDPIPVRSFTRVAGRPTIRTDSAVNGTDYYLSDEWHGWTIAAPGSVRNAFFIQTKERGPGLDDFNAAVDHLIASVTLDPAVRHDDTTDCGAPFPSQEASPSPTSPTQFSQPSPPADGLSRKEAFAAALAAFPEATGVISVAVGRVHDFIANVNIRDRWVWGVVVSGSFPSSCGPAPPSGATAGPCPEPATRMTVLVDYESGKFVLAFN